MSRFNVFSFVMFLAAICATTAGADAQDYLWGYHGAYWGYASIYATESVPYFALHPPVYYSLPVARTYGYSPFPYPSGVLTPGSEPPRSQAVRYVYAPAEEENAAREAGPTPLRIENPYVEQPGKSAANGRVRGRQIAPQVVFPALLAGLSRKSR